MMDFEETDLGRIEISEAVIRILLFLPTEFPSKFDQRKARKYWVDS